MKESRQKCCKSHNEGIWLEGICYCHGCGVEMTDATWVCTETIDRVLQYLKDGGNISVIHKTIVQQMKEEAKERNNE